MNDSRVKILPKSSWNLTGESWESFIRWLDDGIDSEGRSYLEMRRRLAAYFDRKNCRNPDELADETLDRVSRRLQEEGSIETETPAKYCYTVARFVFMESLRSKESKHDSIDQISRTDEFKLDVAGREKHEQEEKEKMLECLDKCSGELDLKGRDLIFGYYVGDERVKIDNRRSMAAKLGITVNALSIRAFRIRDKLEACVRQCYSGK